MERATEVLAPAPAEAERAQNLLPVFSSASVLNILKLIFAGAPLHQVLTIIAQLVESQSDGMLCTICLFGPALALTLVGGVS